MKRLVFGFFFIFLFLTQGAIVLSQSSSNSALADVSISWMTYTSEDAIDNVDVRWQKHPYYRIVNSADGTNEAILNPEITIESSSEMFWLFPSPAIIGPPTYKWTDGSVPQGYWYIAGGFEEECLDERPRFSASRTVSPERLTGEVTEQTVLVSFKLEEPLPSDVNEVAINVGFYPIVSAHPLAPTIVGYTLLTNDDPVGWEVMQQGTSGIEWYTFSPEEIVIGDTYEFRATFRAVKSPLLEGSPISKPEVSVMWRKVEWLSEETGTSVTINYPYEDVKATFQADNELRWTGMVSSSYHFLGFSHIVTPIIGKEPPFNTLSTLRFELHSNADLHVYDPVGRHVGLNYASGEEEVEIPGAHYQYDEIQVITVPESSAGSYRVVLIGTSTGTYELTIAGTTDTEQTFISETCQGQIEEDETHDMWVTVPSAVEELETADLNVAPELWSCSSQDASQSTFNVDETIFVNGNGFPASTAVTVYVVPDGETLTRENAVAKSQATTSSNGTLSSVLAWQPPLTLGEYDLWVDVNQNMAFDTGDALNDKAFNVNITSGLFICPVDSVALAENPNSIAVDETRNRVYIGMEGGIIVLDGETNEIIDEITLGFGVDVLEFNSRTGQLYASGYDLATGICVIDSDGEVVGHFGESIAYPYWLAVNPTTNYVYVTDPTTTFGRYDKVHVYDGGTLNEIATIDIPESTRPVYIQGLGVAVNPSTNRVYIAWTYRNTLLVYNGIDQSLITKKENLTSFSKTIFVNPSTNHIYIGGFTLDETLDIIEGIYLLSSDSIKEYISQLDLIVYSGSYGSVDLMNGQDNNKLLSVEIDHDVDQAAVNSLTNRIYVIDTYRPTLSVLSFGVDNEPPSVQVTSPMEGSLLSVESFGVEWAGSDEGSGIEHYEVRRGEYSWIDKGLETQHNFTYVSDGNRSVTVRAFDYAGNWNEATVNFYVDTTPPNIYFATPTDEATVKATDVTVRWGGYDSYGIERFEIRIDGGTWIDKGTSEEHAFTRLEEGTHTLTLRGYGVAGHMTEVSIIFQVNLSLIGGSGWIDDIKSSPQRH